MYLWLENNYFIPLSEIISIVNIEKFKESKLGKEYLEIYKNKLINLADREKKTLIITDNFIYLTSYTGRALYSRAMEFEKLKKHGKRIKVEV